MNPTRLATVVSISIFFIALIFSPQAYSQWQKINIGTAQTLTDVSPVSGDTLYIAGFEGMFKTVNAGTSWTKLPIDVVGSYFYKTQFFNSKKGIGVGPITMANSEVIAKTVNAGVNWSMVSVSNGGNWPREFNDLDFPSPSIGYAVGRNGRVLKTTNGGDTWTAIISNGSTNFLGASFDAVDHGYLVSANWVQEINGTAIVKTTLVALEANLVDVQALSASELIVISKTKLRRTTNGGTTWTTYTLPFTDITCMFVYSSQIIYAGTEHGVYVTKDGGAKWELFKETKTAHIESIHVDANGRGFIAARDGVVFKTLNAGGVPSPVVHFTYSTQGNCNYTALNLKNETNPAYPFKWLLNDQVVSTDFQDTIRLTEVFSGKLSLIAGSGPSADTLTKQIYIDVQNVHANAGNDVQVCYNEPVKLNATGSFYYSWSPTTGLSDPNIENPVSTYPGTIDYVVSVSNDFGCVDKDTVRIVRAESIPSATWSKTELTTAFPVERMQLLNDTLGFAIAGDKVLVTEDAGLHWKDHSTLSGASLTNYNDIHFITPDTGFVVSRFLYMTTDGGLTYTEDPIGSNPGGIFDIEFVNSKVGYALVNSNGGDYTAIYKTVDGGLTWTPQFNMVGQLYKMTCLKNGTCIAVGSDRMLTYGAYFVRTTDGVNWQKSTYPSVNHHTVYDVAFVDNTTGYAVSMGQKVWKTVDGGASWSVNYTLPDDGKSIKFLNNAIGYIGTYNGRILQTVNGGQCWQDMGKVHSTWIEEIHLRKNLAFFASGETVFADGVIYRTGIPDLSKQSQAITFLPLADKSITDASFALTAVASSGLAVTYTSSNNAIATVNGNIVTITGAGSVTITATQAGNSVYSPAPAASQTLLVKKANQTITFNALPNQVTGSAPMMLTASATSGLPVSYTSSDNAIATINGNMVTIIAAGSVSITATQAGNSVYAPATAVVRTLLVNKQNQTITFNTLPPQVTGGVPIMLTGSATSGLAVSYTSSDNAIATINGNMVTIIAAGSVSITATQVGNSAYAPATAVVRTLLVSKQNQTITFEALSQHTVGGAPFVLTATASSGLPITYISSNNDVATVSGNVVTLRGAGSAVIKATQSGNNVFNPATDVSQTLVVGSGTIIKLDQSIIFNWVSSRTIGDPDFTLTAAASSGLSVTFSSSNTAVAVVEGNNVKITGGGTTFLSASQAGNDQYNAAGTIGQLFTVNKLQQSIEFASPPEEIETGTKPFLLDAWATSGLPITFTSSNKSIVVVNGNVCTVAGEGTASITATQSGNSTYGAASPVSHTVVVMLLTANEQPLDRMISFYPNPVVEWMYIELGEFKPGDPVTVDITDSFTRSLTRITSNEQKLAINLSSLSAGVYYLNLIQGEKRIRSRFIKL